MHWYFFAIFLPYLRAQMSDCFGQPFRFSVQNHVSTTNIDRINVVLLPNESFSMAFFQKLSINQTNLIIGIYNQSGAFIDETIAFSFHNQFIYWHQKMFYTSNIPAIVLFVWVQIDYAQDGFEHFSLIQVSKTNDDLGTRNSSVFSAFFKSNGNDSDSEKKAKVFDILEINSGNMRNRFLLVYKTYVNETSMAYILGGILNDWTLTGLRFSPFKYPLSKQYLDVFSISLFSLRNSHFLLVFIGQETNSSYSLNAQYFDIDGKNTSENFQFLFFEDKNVFHHEILQKDDGGFWVFWKETGRTISTQILEENQFGENHDHDIGYANCSLISFIPFHVFYNYNDEIDEVDEYYAFFSILENSTNTFSLFTQFNDARGQIKCDFDQPFIAYLPILDVQKYFFLYWNNQTISFLYAKFYENLDYCTGDYDSYSNCMQCDQAHKLTKTGKKCVDPIENCVEYNDTSGVCNLCLENFILTTNQKACLLRIEKCAEYRYLDGSCISCDNELQPIPESEGSSDLQCVNLLFTDLTCVDSWGDDFNILALGFGRYMIYNKNFYDASFSCRYVETSFDKISNLTTKLMFHSIAQGRGFADLPFFIDLGSTDNKKIQVLALLPVITLGSPSYHIFERINFLHRFSLEKDEPIFPKDFLFNAYPDIPTGDPSKSIKENLTCYGWINFDRFPNENYIFTWINVSTCDIYLGYFDSNFTLLNQTIIDNHTFKVECKFQINSTINIVILDENRFVLAYSCNCTGSMQIIKISQNYSFNKEKAFLANEKCPFNPTNPLDGFQIQKTPTGFFAVWRYYFQKFDGFGNQITDPINFYNGTISHLNQNISFPVFQFPLVKKDVIHTAILSDGRLIIVFESTLGVKGKNDGKFTITFYIEGEDSLHIISENSGDMSRVAAQSFFDNKTNKSSFMILWKNSGQIIGKLYQAKFIQNCIRYAENLNDCLKCEPNYIVKTVNLSDFCIPEISNCNSYSGTYDEICNECKPEYFLADNNKSCIYKVNNVINNTDRIVLETVLPILCFILFLVLATIFYRMRQIKILQERPDIQLLHMDPEERTKQRLIPLIQNEEETDYNLGKVLFKTYVDNLEKKNEVTCYEILKEDDAFQTFFQLKLVAKIGSGGFGQVWKVEDKLDQVYALKLFISKTFSSREIDLERFNSMTQELQIINQLNSDSIVRTLGIGYSFSGNHPSLGIVLELMDLDLTSYLKGNRYSETLREQLEMAISISNAFLFIHHRGFVHHDVKPGNILIRKKGIAFDIKISDFGTTLRIKEDENKVLNGISREYAAPENILHFCFRDPFLNHPKSDIWSIGIVFYRIFIENKNVIFPWSAHLKTRLDGSYNRVIRQQIEKCGNRKNMFVKTKTKGLPLELVSLINQCLQVDIERRPNIEDILENLGHLRHNLHRFEI